MPKVDVEFVLGASGSFAIGCRVDAMSFENIGDCGIADRVANFGELTLNPVATPGWILLGKLRCQIDDDLSDSWTSKLLLPIGVIPFEGDQPSMPAKNGVGREQGANLIQHLSAEDLALHSKSSSLIIVEQVRFLTSFCLST